MTDDLIAFLRARLDEDEQIANAATPPPWVAQVGAGSNPDDGRKHTLVGRVAVDVPGRQKWLYSGNEHGGTAVHIANWDPARVLADVDAKRKIVDAYLPSGGDPHPGLPCINYEGQDPAEYFSYDSCERHIAASARLLRSDYVLRLLALPYVDHPDYREEWRP